MADDAELLRVLHALRLVGFGDEALVADRSGLSRSRARPILASAAGAGWVVHRSGRLSGWVLTAGGRSQGEALLAQELRRSGAGEAVQAGYRRFGAVNQRFLELCTDWQLRADSSGRRAVNDHHDPAYDDAIVSRLIELDDVIQPIVEELAATLTRFDRYGPRLAGARRFVEAGDLDWFTRPVIDSYHTVWFELHEDLLATLGLERADERS